MKIILFTHPLFLSHQSMPRFAKMIMLGMKQKGHEISVWYPTAIFSQLAFKNAALKKWLGYLDQFFIFPLEVKIRLLSCTRETLFVFSDNALGPWVPLVRKKHHVVHCHDFLAQQSAFGLLPESKTGISGKQYQKFIFWGYSKAKNFISISRKTQTDLHFLLPGTPKISQVVYNGLNQNFEPVKDIVKLRKVLSNRYNINFSRGYILHVGGNAFYKNKFGVLEIYQQWAISFKATIPLILIGEQPTSEMIAYANKSIASESIYFLTNIDDVQLKQFYQGCSVMVFPSLYEGFGWPIIEAMASGSIVITTDEDPMKEVAGNAGFYIPKKPIDSEKLLSWKITAATVLERIMKFTPEQRKDAILKSILNSKKFSTQDFINSIEKTYLKILENK
ncbi:Glycosyltransferase involved in cell wall bisynthesis [Flavobacterium segetis]|uniref:Glycosyltransferase involved in cell wall bisynthesis n=1 Tax=Flavobacterium segetis TaxID=271157 RepID=A0A1M5I1F4_9FLAO|nr:glycosyltransferase [Flavobacterium segetis]SHG21853.1 Glycosyltransferase involved in cell wall bisynthesis [Flavobacterium segetis]